MHTPSGTTTETRSATIADFDALQELIAGHPYAEYRCYRLFKHDFATDYLAHGVQTLLEQPDPLACLAVAGGRVVGFAGATRSDVESDCFGLEMASLRFILAAGDGAARVAIVDALLTALMARARARGVLHLTLKVDLADVTTLHAAEQSRFRLMDTLVTYVDVAARHPEPRPQITSGFELATYWKDQFHELTREETEPFIDFARSSYRLTRFHMDHRLPAERADELSADWCRNVFNGKWADMIHVVRRDGRLVGFLGLQYSRELEARYGVKVAGRGFSGVLPEGRGAYSAVVGLSLVNTPHDFGEFDTQIQNFPVINVWIRHGLAFLRGRFTLHRWLDEGLRPA